MKTRCNKENRFSSGSPCCYTSEQSVLLSGYYFFIFPLPLPFVKLLPSNFLYKPFTDSPLYFSLIKRSVFPATVVVYQASSFSLFPD